MTGHSYVGSTPVGRRRAGARRAWSRSCRAPASRRCTTTSSTTACRGCCSGPARWSPTRASPSSATCRRAARRSRSASGHRRQLRDATAPNPQTGCGLPNSAALSGHRPGHRPVRRLARRARLARGRGRGRHPGLHDPRRQRQRRPHPRRRVVLRRPRSTATRRQGVDRPVGPRLDQRRCGDGDGAASRHPNCRFEQWQYALHAWFDKHLQQRDVDTGPAVEAFLNGEDAVDVTAVIDPETLDSKVLTARRVARARPAASAAPRRQRLSLGTDAADVDGAAPASAPAPKACWPTSRGGSVAFTSAPVARGHRPPRRCPTSSCTPR